MSPNSNPIPDANAREQNPDSQLSFIGIAARVVILICAIAPLIPGAIFFLMFAAQQPETHIQETPDGSDRGILIESHAGWIYAPHTVNVMQTGGWRQREILSTDLANDGANLGPDNVQLQWQNSFQAILRLDGEEQEPVCHLLSLGQKPTTEEIACPPFFD